MTIRKELELSVGAMNKPLQGKVSSMTLVELLRNCDPMFRSDFANRLYKLNELEREDAKEFTKIVGNL